MEPSPNNDRPKFRGQHVHTIDGKGRLSLPARFREILLAQANGQFILVPSFFRPCLEIQPMAVWEDFERRLDAMPKLDEDIQLLRRVYQSAAVECELDRAGRLLIPPHLREKARLEGDVMVAALGSMIELWSKAIWDESHDIDAPANQASLRRAAEKTAL